MTEQRNFSQTPHWSTLSLEEQIQFWEQRAQVNSRNDTASVQADWLAYSEETERLARKNTDRRGRGDHSIACKCPQPEFYRPAHFENLPAGEIAKAYRRLVKVDRETGAASLRIRMSNHPVFVQLRRAVGRKRAFRAVRRALIDALFPLMLSCIDFTTHILTLNLSKMADALSLYDEDGNMTEKVTSCRVSRLIGELLRFGVLEDVDPKQKQWDALNRRWFPKHVAFTQLAWQMLNADLDKLRADQQQRLQAEADGILEPGEEISVRAARQRWMERMRRNTLTRRREKSHKSRQTRKLKDKTLDERLNHMAEYLSRTLPVDELMSYSQKAFDRLCYQHLLQLDLHMPTQAQAPPVH